MDVNAYLEKHRKVISERMIDTRPVIECADGLILSVQASRTHYCSPRGNHGPYSRVEIGFPSERVEELIPYAGDKNNPTETIYGWVPVELVEEVIEKHGGIVN